MGDELRRPMMLPVSAEKLCAKLLRRAFLTAQTGSYP